VFLVRQVLLAGLDDRIDEALVKESRELNRLADRGIDPDTGEPFGTDVARLLEVFLERNVPARNEALLTFISGEPYVRSRNVLPYRLDEDDELVERWSSISEADAGSVETPGGTVRYLAVPILAGGETQAVFVAAVFRDLEAEEIQPAVRAATLVGIAGVLIGSLLAFLLARRRIIKPVQAVETTARTISESDLSRRIEVNGDDETPTWRDVQRPAQPPRRSRRSAAVDDAGELRTPIRSSAGSSNSERRPEQRRRARSRHGD
jgi:hypothetical protein